MSGGGGFAFGGGDDIYGIANTGPNMNYADDVSWIKGSHQFGFGGSYIRTMLQSRTGVNANGGMTFNGSVTGNGNANLGLGMADFLLGLASSWRQGNLALYDNRENNIGLYNKDSWKLSSRLTLSYGVRWEPFFPFTSKHGWLAHFDPTLFAQNAHSTVFPNAPAGMVFPGDPNWVSGNGVAKNRLNQFMPRIGLVWDQTGNGKMVVRAAYGRFTDRPHLLMGTSMAGAPPFGNLISLANVNMSTPWATYPGGVNPLPIPLDKNVTFPSFGSYTTYPVDWRPTALNQWNLSIQRQVGTDWLLTANYVGNNTSHLIVSGELNPAIYIPGKCGTANCSTTANTNQRRLYYLLNPAQGQFYSTISRLDDGGTGSYNGLLLAVQKRLSRGVSVLANYTWSHCISDQWNGYRGLGGTSEGVPDNRRYGRGNCLSSDQRQILNLSAVAQTPNFSNRPIANNCLRLADLAHHEDQVCAVVQRYLRIGRRSYGIVGTAPESNYGGPLCAKPERGSLVAACDSGVCDAGAGNLRKHSLQQLKRPRRLPVRHGIEPDLRSQRSQDSTAASGSVQPS